MLRCFQVLAIGVAVCGLLAECSRAAADSPSSVSVGSPNDGKLKHGRTLPPSGPGFMQNPNRPNSTAGYGTDELIQAIGNAAAEVHQQHPGAQLMINDISLPDGGPIRRHGSHQSGRDADVLFYLLDSRGQSMPSKGVPLDRRGRGWDFKELLDPRDDVAVRLDAPRTWAFVRALVQQPESSLQRIFVVEHVRELLLQQGRQQRAPRRLIQRAGDVMCQPAVAHDDHLHLRFFCSAQDIGRGCLDTAPVYPWWREQLRAAGTAAVLAPFKRRPSQTVSRQQARLAAGPMHAKVQAFLALQDTWASKPSPGRRWCP